MDVTSALEKLESRENFINAQFEPLVCPNNDPVYIIGQPAA